MATKDDISEPTRPGPGNARWIAQGTMVYDTEPFSERGSAVGPFADAEAASESASRREAGWAAVVSEAASRGFAWRLAPDGRHFDWCRITERAS